MRYFLGHRFEFWPREENEIRTFLKNTGLDNIQTERLTWSDEFENGGEVFDFYASTSGLWWYHRLPPKIRNIETESLLSYYSFGQWYKEGYGMEIIVEVIMWFIIEVVFWGIMFWTGYLLVSFVTFGHWPLKILGNGNAKIKKNRKKPEFIVTAIIGAIFWMSVGIGLTILIKST